MGRISYLDKEQVAPEAREIFDTLERALRRIPNIFRAMAHAPVFFQKFMEFNGALRSTKLDPKLRELAYLKASQVNRCNY